MSTAVVTAGGPTRSARRTGIGLLLVAPAALALLTAYVFPTAWMVVNSLQRGRSLLRDDSPEWTGTANYEELSRYDFWGAVGYSLSLAVVPLLLVAVVSLALALAASRAGRAGRWVTRVALAIPLAVVTPTGLALAWVVDRGEGSPGSGGVVRTALWATTAGLALAIGTTFYLAALNRPGTARPPWRTVTVVGGLAALGTVALALQQFSYPFVVANGRVGRAATPLLLLYETFFVRLEIGVAAAMATLLLVALMLLGLAATVLVITSRLRIEVNTAGGPGGDPAPAPGSRTLAVVGTAVGVFALLAVIGYGLLPWLRTVVVDAQLPIGIEPGRVLANTWLPPIVSTVVSIGLALLAAIGIGALRPLGRASEWLLLPFGLWLFVGAGPLVVHTYMASADTGTVDSIIGLIPWTWVAIPALFVLTLLFRGQRERWDRLRATGQPAPVGRILVVPAIPMVALLGGVTWLVQSQDLLRQLVASSDPDWYTGPVVTARQLITVGVAPGEPGGALALPLALAVVFLVAAIAFQLAYLDRVSVRTGEPAAGEPAGGSGVPDGPAVRAG